MRVQRTDLGERQRQQLFTSGSEHRLDREPPLELGQELVLHRRVDERRHQSVQLAGLSRPELQDGLLGLPGLDQLGLHVPGVGQVVAQAGPRAFGHRLKSAEHTPELQSLMREPYAVFCSNNNKHATSIPSSLCQKTKNKVQYLR